MALNCYVEFCTYISLLYARCPSGWQDTAGANPTSEDWAVQQDHPSSRGHQGHPEDLLHITGTQSYVIYWLFETPSGKTGLIACG
jgi:hypothetical protein